MSIVGPDGQTPLSSEAKAQAYKVGGVRIDSADTPESMLSKALIGAQQVIAQQVGTMSLQRSGSQIVAQAEAQQAAAKVTNPFQIEPCALGLFMLMAREIEHRDNVIAALAERLDKVDGQNSEELFKKPWDEKQADENAETKDPDDAFSQAAENLTNNNESEN